MLIEYNLIMKVIRITTAIFLLFCLGFTAFYGRQKISEGLTENAPAEYKGIITLWHVDSFEGGTGSRKQFLLSSARAFEKANKGVLVMVINKTEEGIRESFNKGVFPDLISYGIGIEVLSPQEIRTENKFVGGMVGAKTYAIPWCRGGYVLIANPKLVDEIGDELEELLISQGENTLPAVALCLENITAKKIEIKKPMDAYVKFVSGKTPYFLGTQRDVNRLNNRGMEVITRPLTAFNDLYQYVAVTAKDENKRFFAEQFINHLESEVVQKKLNQIGMLSVFFDGKNQNEHLEKMQRINDFKTISAFTSPSIIKELQSLSLNFASGEENSLNKIKNLLV